MTELETDIGAINWWHSIDLGHGVVTPGYKSADLLEQELAQLGLPDLHGKSVLDVGAWDGFFSFAAERLGAKRVVALDYFSWLGKDGRRGFDVARAALQSSVEPMVANFMTMDLEVLGTFDVVLFLGVLYHLREPILGLERLAQVTFGTAFVETQAFAIGGLPELAACEFYETDELAGDASNWWSPTARALAGMCRVAGFHQVEVTTDAPSDLSLGESRAYRAVARASRG